MLFAESNDGQKIFASKNKVGYCPSCKAVLIPKMGPLLIHHWAHASSAECSSYKPMTEWHYKWLNKFINSQKWSVEHQYGAYRFDCFSNEENLVLEFQRLPLFQYMVEKSEYCIYNNIEINWIYHSSVFNTFKTEGEYLIAPDRRRRAVLDFFEYIYRNKGLVNFYVDITDANPAYESVKTYGLYKLHSLERTLKTGKKVLNYYKLMLEKHTSPNN